MIVYLLYIGLVIMFILAIIWEIKDHQRIQKLPNIGDIKNRKHKEIYYRLLAKFPYENTITWRMLYITSVIVTIILWFILPKCGVRITTETCLVVFLIILISFRLSAGLISFHFYRVLAGKIDPHIVTI